MEETRLKAKKRSRAQPFTDRAQDATLLRVFRSGQVRSAFTRTELCTHHTIATQGCHGVAGVRVVLQHMGMVRVRTSTVCLPRAHSVVPGGGVEVSAQ